MGVNVSVDMFPQACRDFLDLAETHSRRWQRALQYEREQRTHLEETIEQLAKQHNSLERAWREAPTLASSTPSAPTTNKGETDCLCYLLLWASARTSLHWLKIMCDLRLTVIPHIIRRFGLDSCKVRDGDHASICLVPPPTIESQRVPASQLNHDR